MKTLKATLLIAVLTALSLYSADAQYAREGGALYYRAGNVYTADGGVKLFQFRRRLRALLARRQEAVHLRHRDEIGRSGYRAGKPHRRGHNPERHLRRSRVSGDAPPRPGMDGRRCRRYADFSECSAVMGRHGQAEEGRRRWRHRIPGVCPGTVLHYSVRRNRTGAKFLRQSLHEGCQHRLQNGFSTAVGGNLLFLSYETT